jgi:hypothetical protein
MDIASCDYKEAVVNTVFLQKEELVKKQLFLELMRRSEILHLTFISLMARARLAARFTFDTWKGAHLARSY